MSTASSSPFPCFALLDDASADSAQSRLYTGLQQVLVCHGATEWEAFWADVQAGLAKSWHAVALLSYETGAALHGVEAYSQASLPSRVLLFADCQFLQSTEVQAWLEQHADNSSPAGIANLQPNIDEAQFADDIARIRDYIAAGDTYQVNYTYRHHFTTYGSPITLYQRLRERQPVPYGALICLPDGEAVLSLSPELFVRHQAGQLFAKPMKGTAPATGIAQDDDRAADALAHDDKNRAENLMIVDLLRNDLGRIAQAGTVKVSQLFEVERFSSVLQMTSSITARVKPDLGLAQVLAALYPCGSITGAPKRRSMQIIRELEPEPRGIYTGAIGWFAPPEMENHSTQALGDFCLSVPIRTLHLQAPSAPQEPHSMRQGTLGVGAGIVYDSNATDEFQECQWKAAFLTGLPAQFSLFETIYITREQGCRHLEKHLQRLQQSAQFFGFPYPAQAIPQALQAYQADLPPQTAYRLRLALNSAGEVSVQGAPLSPLTLPAKVLLAPQPTRGSDLFLRHKTTWRSHYDQAWQAAEQQGAFDMLFFNDAGYLTEGGRSNVFIQLDGAWFTPPLTDGVLHGVMRSVVLSDPKWKASERSLTLDDVQHADKIMLCNALRGVFEVELVNRVDAEIR